MGDGDGCIHNHHHIAVPEQARAAAPVRSLSAPQRTTMRAGRKSGGSGVRGRGAVGRTAIVTSLGLWLIAGVALAAPDADFDASPRSPVAGETVTFTAEDSCEAPVTCVWSFGDGSGGEGRSVSHAYASPGEQTVTLTVDDPGDDERPDRESRRITVRRPPPVEVPNQPPSAVISPASASPRKGQDVRFDSSGSADPDGGRLDRGWDLDGDGSFDDGSGVTATRSFPIGTFTVRLKVTDSAGASASASAKITVANGAPTASIRASSTTPLSFAPVKFTAVASDPEGSAVRRQWDLDKDGFDDGTDVTVSRSFKVPGPGEARLRVTDGDGASTTAVLRFTVRNQAPKAAFTYGPNPVDKGRPIAFRSQSADPEGRLDKHEWDFDGDGRFDDASGPNPTRSFPVVLRRIDVRLRVTDKDGGSNVRTAVIVPGNLSPTVTLKPSPASPLTAESVTFTTTARDPDGSIAAYGWAVDGVPAAEGGPALTTSFATSGPHVVGVTVSDNAGGSTTVEAEVHVVERAPLVFTYAPNPVTKGVPVTFTAAAADPAAKFDALAWDLDGDGQFDDGTGTSVTTVYPSALKVFVGLSGTDEDDKPISVYREVDVQEGTGLTATPPGEATVRLMRPFPVVRFAGRLTARGARLQLLSVRAPKKAVIRVRCLGKGCPRSRMVRTARVKRLKQLQTSYRAGARIVLRITKPGVVGKYVRITIRKGRKPSRRDACTWPGERKPRACPA
jgi:PKD repeat protein